MPKSRPPYPAAFRQQMVELVRSGRTPGELAREFEPSAEAIRNWVAQADRAPHPGRDPDPAPVGEAHVHPRPVRPAPDRQDHDRPAGAPADRNGVPLSGRRRARSRGAGRALRRRRAGRAAAGHAGHALDRPPLGSGPAHGGAIRPGRSAGLRRDPEDPPLVRGGQGALGRGSGRRLSPARRHPGLVAVGAHLFNTASTATRLHYWRDGPDEVDFVLQRGPRLVAIEVKSGPRRADRRGMDAFSARFRLGRTLLVGEGGVPLNEFLAMPADHWLDQT